MIAVIIASRDQDVWNTLTQFMDEHFSPVHAHNSRLTLSSEPSAFALCDMQSFSQIESEQVILLYQDALPLTAELKGARQVVAVVDSAKDELLDHVASTRLDAITCGLLSRDTITLSSLDDDSAVLSVQRSIQCFDGTEVEPQEIPVRFSRPTDPFALMAVASICILSGNLELLQGARI